MALPEVTTLAAYTVAAVAPILAPGPDTAFVLAQSVGGGRSASRPASSSTPTARWSGSPSTSGSPRSRTRPSGSGGGLPPLPRRRHPPRRGRHRRRGADGRGSFRQGLATNVLNPKVALFFLAFLPQFGRGPELLPLGGLYALLTAVYLGGVALASGTAREAVARPGVRTWLRRTAGGTMLALGASVALGDRLSV